MYFFFPIQQFDFLIENAVRSIKGAFPISEITIYPYGDDGKKMDPVNIRIINYETCIIKGLEKIMKRNTFFLAGPNTVMSNDYKVILN